MFLMFLMAIRYVVCPFFPYSHNVILILLIKLITDNFYTLSTNQGNERNDMFTRWRYDYNNLINKKTRKKPKTRVFLLVWG